MEKLQNFLNLYGEWWENVRKNPESLKESFKRVFKLYPQAIDRLFGNNETTEEKIADRVEPDVGNKQMQGFFDMAPYPVIMKPPYLRDNGQS